MIEFVEAAKNFRRSEFGVLRGRKREESWSDGRTDGGRLPFVRTKVIGNVIKIGEIGDGRTGQYCLLPSYVCSSLSAVGKRIFSLASKVSERAREVKLKERAIFVHVILLK